MASPDKTPYLDDGDFRLYQGEALEVLSSLPAGSVHCVVTSPPYWGLRDYGTASWEGGDPDCDHLGEPFRTKANLNENWGAGFSDVKNAEDRQPFKEVCGKCGARRVDQALGLEATPELYVARMVDVFREVRRVLRGDGVCWVNLGDSYASSGERGNNNGEGASTMGWPGQRQETLNKAAGMRLPAVRHGLKPKDLVGIPWRVAFALQADGWYLRSDVIWSKPNPMPESVTDRPTKAHEYVFLLAKSPRYFFDQEAVREPHQPQSLERWKPGTPRIESTDGNNKNAELNRQMREKGISGNGPMITAKSGDLMNPSGRNIRSVWEIATQPYPEAHFATYPEELVRRCILAGTSERGCCPECGAPWQRESERTGANNGDNERVIHDGVPGLAARSSHDRVRSLDGKNYQHVKQATNSFVASCDHDQSPVPCTVLDPFGGSGTTALVARKHGRRSILIELSGPYCELAALRLSQLSLLSGVQVG